MNRLRISTQIEPLIPEVAKRFIIDGSREHQAQSSLLRAVNVIDMHHLVIDEARRGLEPGDGFALAFPNGQGRLPTVSVVGAERGVAARFMAVDTLLGRCGARLAWARRAAVVDGPLGAAVALCDVPAIFGPEPVP